MVGERSLPRSGWRQLRRRALWQPPGGLRQLQADTRNWLEKDKSAGYQWSHERVREAVSALTKLGPEVVLSEPEEEFLGPVDAAAMLAELDRSETTHRRRALIGERFDVLGDPRPGVGVDPDGAPEIRWCPVPGGEVEIDAEPGRKQVDGFQIARYPITAAQYRAFLEAEDGWRNQVWWADDLYRDPDGDSYDPGRFGNHPAVYVRWFDALAFCRWLSRRLDVTVNLPDEWAWQQAATGGDAGNVFPWGADWDPKTEPHRANTFESRLGGATAVGVYPAGAVPEGARDLAGTVWEWCLNKYDRPDLTVSLTDDFETRVVRGGSWYSIRDYARCAYRSQVIPNNLNSQVGFRVVCSSPIIDP